MKAWTPLLLTVLGFAGLGSLAVYRMMTIESLPMLLVGGAGMAMYAGWMLWESRVSVKEISKPEPDRDRGTMELCAFVKISLLVAALAGRGSILTDRGAILAGIGGLVLLAAGILLRTNAIRTMGDAYSHRIRTPRFPLVTHGPYAWIRHPAYAGTVLIHAGAVLIFLNVVSAVALAAWLVAVWYRTHVEEQWLSTFPEYQEYKARVTGAWIPGRRSRPLSAASAGGGAQ